MRVKTIASHANEYGDGQEKKKGDEYDCSDQAAQSLIANGLVVEVKPKA